MITNVQSIACATPGNPVPADDGIPEMFKRRKPLVAAQHGPQEAATEKPTSVPKTGAKGDRLPVPAKTGARAPKPIHAADAADLARIPSAVHFIASIFIGTGKFDKHQEPTLPAARATAKRMEAEHKNGRLGLVYAVMPDGHSILVPVDYDPAAPKPTPAPEAGRPSLDGPTLTKPAAKAKTPTEKEKPVKAAPAKKAAAAPKAAKAAAPARAPKKAAEGARNRYDWTGAEEKAAKGVIAAAPDFSAATHERFRPLLAEVVKAARAGDIEALRKITIGTSSSSPKAIHKYRGICVKALKVKNA